MSKLMEVAEKEMIRNEILNMCSMAAPDGANIKVLRVALKKSGYSLSEDEIKKQVSYLANKGFVVTREITNQVLEISRTIVFITSTGTDFLEGGGQDG